MTGYSISWLVGGERISYDTPGLTLAAIGELADMPIDKQPYVSGPGFVARLEMSSRWAASAKPEWRLQIPGNGGFKSAVCARAESAGVRYASKRKGYVASRTAFRRFLTAMAEAG